MLSWSEAMFSLLAEVALKGALVLAMAWLVAFAMRRHSAARRHLVWTAAFAALLALPLLSVSLPGVPLPVSSAVSGPVAVFRATAAVSPAQVAPGGGTAASSPAVHPDRHTDWRFWLVLVWAAGTAIGLLQMAAGWMAVWRARRDARPLPNDLDDAVEILETGEGSMPITFGLFRPAILLPADAAEWTAERRRLVLLHELAHVKRGDTVTHLIARFALHLYWWNPLAWMAWRAFVRERERAADDLVLAAGARASEYAGHLLEIARGLQSAPAVGWASIAVARRSQLEGRLAALLQSNLNRAPSRRASAWIAALAAMVITLPLAVLRAEDQAQVMPADVDATIRAAASAKNNRMLDDAARAAAGYLKYDTARQLLDASLAIRSTVAGPQSVDYGMGLVKIADLERSRGNFDEARAFYAKAATVLSGQPGSARPLVNLGIDALTRKDSPQAKEYFERAQAADPMHAGMAMMWLGIVNAADHPAEAESFYRGALAIEPSDSPETATTMEVFAAFLDRQGSLQEAATLRNQAADLRKQLGARAAVVRRASSATPYRMGPGLTPPTLANKVEPQYSEEARLAKYQGTAVVAVTVGVDGTAQDMRVVRGLGLGLDERALQAISQWHFNPGKKDGEPVPVMATIEVNFRLL